MSEMSDVLFKIYVRHIDTGTHIPNDVLPELDTDHFMQGTTAVIK